MAVTPMPLISRIGAPYSIKTDSNDSFGGTGNGGAFPSDHAADATYGGTDYWRCAAAPASNANSGTLTQAFAFTTPFPVWLAYDLSAVPSSLRGQVLVHWEQSATTGAYDPTLISNNPNNVPTSYTIDVNATPFSGTSAPSSGWVTKVTVTNSNPYHSRQHLLDMTGYVCIRINVTAVTGSASNNNVALNMDVHSAPSGATDSWFFAGDSITQRGFMWDDQNGIGFVPSQLIANTYTKFYPVWECGGVGGWTATDAQAVFSTWMGLFPGKFVALNFGTNDANLGGSYMTNYQSKMQSMVTTALGQGCKVIIPTIPWLNTSSQAQTNVNTLNALITGTLVPNNPGCILGPDLYGYFSTHQSEISSDGLHPTDPALSTGNGYVDYRGLWATWAAKIYNAQSQYFVGARHRHRMAVF